MGTTLFKIGDDMQALLSLVDEADAELSPETEQALDKWFAELKGQERAKLDGYVALVRELEGRAAIRNEERDRLAKLVSAEENKAKRLKERLRDHFTKTGLKKVETDRYRLTLCGAGGKAPLEKPDDARLLTPRFVITRYEADTEAIRAALAAGEEVMGCRLLERGNYIKIS